MKHFVDIGRWSAGYRSVLFVLLAGFVLMYPGGSFLQPVMGQDEPKADAAPAAAADEPAAGAAAAAPAAESAAPAVQSKSFLSYIWNACGWFWGPAFLLVSFILVALIMMNLLQVRRDVLLPAQFVEEFEQKLNAKDFQGAYEYARGDDSFVARVLASGMSRLSRGYEEAVEGMQEAGEDENMSL